MSPDLLVVELESRSAEGSFWSENTKEFADLRGLDDERPYESSRICGALRIEIVALIPLCGLA